MAMLTSGEYNLTKKNVVHEKKSMFFVKLTDSAQRALNNYFRAMDKCDVPIIEFNKNEGRILIPTIPSNKGSDTLMAQYKFDVKSNVAMQGRQGRFECVQHVRGSKQLIEYGQLTQRLTIQASEDSYSITKERMAAIGKQLRENCPIQLDWNSTTINRRVKLEKNNTTKNIQSMNKVEEHKPVPVPVVTMAASNMIRSKSRPVHNPPPQKINTAACIIRKPLKERIIHLLALRPHKKLELDAVLKKGGLRECDKPHLNEVLLSVSNIHGNVYHLSKHAWNDVQEDWLFYTEQEKQQIKKNKLRNLTSPSSSDSGVSVGSNQSPNSNMQPQPPPTSSSVDKYKRPGYSVGTDGFQTKRQRISHFVKQEPSVKFEENSQSMVQTCLDECQPQHQPSSHYIKHDTVSHSVKQEPWCQSRFDEITRSNCSPPADKFFSQKSITQNVAPKSKSNSQTAEYSYFSSQKDVPVVVVSSPEVTSTCNNQEDDTLNFTLSPTRSKHFWPKSAPYTLPMDSGRYTPQVVTAAVTSQYHIADASSFDSPHTNQLEKFLPHPSEMNSTTCQQQDNKRHSNNHNYNHNLTVKPKYLKEYVPIANMEQRRQYKADFNEIFKEYQRVHEDVDSISNIFAQLGESLKLHKKGSPVYKSIEKEILTKYYSLKQNQKYQAAKRRFDYLHEKLSHIKNLVHEYDQKMLRGSS